MKILHITPYLNSAYGGPPQAIKSMVDVALSNGHDVQVYSTASGWKNSDLIDYSFKQAHTNKIYHIFNLNFPAFWFHSKDLTTQLKSIAHDIDLFHLHIPFTAPFYHATEIALKLGIPYVASLHGLLDQWSMAQKYWKKIPYYHLFEKTKLMSASALHVTSTLEEINVSKLGLMAPIENIPLSVPTLSLITSLTKHKALLLFIGRLHPVKSIPTILQAIKILSDEGITVTFDIAGAGPQSYEIYLKKLINYYCIESLITWHGHVDALKKQELYKKCNVFTMPSLHENFGLAAAEAMSAGIPVILSDNVGIAPDVQEWGAGFIIPTGNAIALAKSVKKMIQSNNIETMGFLAKDLVNTKYNPIIFSNKLMGMYDRIMQKKHSSS